MPADLWAQHSKKGNTMLDTSRPEVQVAIDAVRQAARLTRSVQQELAGHITKDDKSPVTVADFGAQAVVAKRLAEAFPGAPLVGEEDAAALRAPEHGETLDAVTRFVQHIVPEATPESVCTWIDRGNAEPGSRFWTLDPVDGTKGFLRGDQYAVALALVVDGRVQLGALACPNLTGGRHTQPGGEGTLVIAVRGEGAWMAPIEDGPLARLHVSAITAPREARLLRSFEAAHTNVDQMSVLAQAMGAEAKPVCMDSQAKYAVLAAGHGDVLFRLLSPKQPDYRERIWDQAAGSIIVEEAGGRITDLSGAELDFGQGTTLAKNRGVLATNGHLHDAALDALRQTAQG